MFIWIVVASNYLGGNDFHIGEVSHCKDAQEYVNKYYEKRLRPKGYEGWSCIPLEYHLIKKGYFKK